MLSAFHNTRRRRRGGTTESIDETYDLRGLNMLAPDQVMPDNETPFSENARMYRAEIDEASVAISTRPGSAVLSTPVGQTANVENVAASTGDLEFSADLWVALPYTPNATGLLTKLEPHLKKTTVGTGHVIIEIFSQVSSLPGVLLGQTSILNGDVSDAYAYIAAFFIDAPAQASGTTYWMRFRVQEGGTAVYALNKTAGSGAKSTPDGETYTNITGLFRYKTYLSTAGEILGYTRRYPQNKNNRTYFAMGTKVYEVTDAGTPTEISSAIHANAEYWRTDQVDDKLIWVDGLNTAKWYDGSAVTAIAGVSGNPTHVWVHRNRLFFVPDTDPTRVNFSELYEFESYRSVDFFYVDRPKSSDHISGGCVYQDNLVIFTHETKHTIYGTDLASFTRKEAIGTKGAVSQEAITTDNNFIYFMADDKHIYRWNGVKDKKLSSKVARELAQIQDVKKVRLHVYNNQLRVYYSKAPSTTVDHMLILELDEEIPNKYLQWFRDTGRPVMGSLEWYQDENQLIEFSSKAGWMFTGEQGTTDLGKAIDFKYWTGFKIYGSGAAKDRIRRFRPFVRPADRPYYLNVGKAVDFNYGEITMTPWLVDSGGAKWGSFIFGDGTVFGKGSRLVDNIAPMSGRGKATQFRFECDQVDTPVFLYGYFARVKSGKAK